MTEAEKVHNPLYFVTFRSRATSTERIAHRSFLEF